MLGQVNKARDLAVRVERIPVAFACNLNNLFVLLVIRLDVKQIAHSLQVVPLSLSVRIELLVQSRQAVVVSGGYKCKTRLIFALAKEFGHIKIMQFNRPEEQVVDLKELLNSIVKRLVNF